MNLFLSKLNLPDDARAVVIHVDDIGMSYSTVAGSEITPVGMRALRNALRRSA
jgi:hypothetical protein